MKQKTKAIIPCAGLGKRMGMKHNESKEMLIEPSTGKPVIDYCLQLCKEYDLEPHVITRKEKTDLIEYCKVNNVFVQIIEPEGEWADSVLSSHEYWNDHNILILPDTRFYPTTVIENIKNDLSLGCYFSLALHKVTDPEKWGILVDNCIVKEKPKQSETPAVAWGLIGFQGGDSLHSYGFFNRMDIEKSATFSHFPSLHYLDWFKDITRSGKLE